MIEDLLYPLTVIKFAAKFWVVLTDFVWFGDSFVRLWVVWVVVTSSWWFWLVLGSCSLFWVFLGCFGWFL